MSEPDIDEQCGCTRRRLLKGAGAVAATSMLELATPRMAFASTTTRRGDLLVVVSLRGGADGLTLVPPLADGDYERARPDVAVRPSQAAHLDRSFGLHPGLATLLPLWRARQLAVVHAVGDSDGTRSHFEATDAMERGVNVASRTSTGWVDRYLTTRGLRSGQFPALAIGNQTPVSLHGPAPDLTVTDVQSLRVQVSEARRRDTERALGEMYAAVGGAYADAARETLGALRRLAPLRRAPYVPREGVHYPDDALGHALKQVAAVARAGVGLGVACVEGGGWDTHEGMGTGAGGYAHDLISRLGQALAAFARDLGPLFAETTIVTLSEFGRRVAQNGSGGLDHGHGSAMLVMGGGIRGGRVYGQWPGLATHRLDDGDLRATTDYRDVLGELVTRRLGGGRLPDVFPDHRVRPLGLARQR
jgi:uncharacterized protein (DUF1501 family)